MGISLEATPVSVVSAVIDLNFVPNPASQSTSHEIIELS
jgi:hypothetical protein